MRYVKVKFKPSDTRTYTYEHAGDEPLARGDRVDVVTKDGVVTVTVEDVTSEQPPFRCKPIHRVHPRQPDDAAHGAQAHSPPGEAPPDNPPAPGGETRST